MAGQFPALRTSSISVRAARRENRSPGASPMVGIEQSHKQATQP